MPNKRKKKKLTRGQRVIKFIETFCVIPEGSKVGQQVKLGKFQTKFIIAVYDNPHITDTAILSIARKNAKTGLIAFIVLAHLIGPEAVQNSRINSGAMSKEQAAEVFNLASKTVLMSPKLKGKIRIVSSKKQMFGLLMNVEYQAISAEASTAHGKSPILVILDEVGQIRGPQSDFVSAMETAQGAYDNPLAIYISTQAATDADFFSILLDDAKTNKPKKTVCHLYTTDKDADILDEKSWLDSNPAMGDFRSINDLRKQAEKAARMPSFENTFRHLNLNQRVSTKDPFIGHDAWKACGGKFHVKLEDCEEIYAGLDLSQCTDLTAFILTGKYKGKTYVFCYFWTPEKGLLDREKKDRAPYTMWVKQGHLFTTPGATVKYDFVVREIARITKDIELSGIGFDRWKIEALKKECDAIELDLPLENWGQGFASMSPALSEVEDLVLNEELKHGDNPVLTMCCANSVVTENAARDRKLDKMRATGKIDGMQSLCMALGLAKKTTDPNKHFDDAINDPVMI